MEDQRPLARLVRRDLFLGFLLAFALTSAAVGRFAGFPELGALDDKLRYFAAHKDDYDLIFVGSSRIHRGVVPAVFDAGLAEAGRPLRSFSFGLLGMQPHEAASLVRRLVAMEPARLRFVVIEPGDFDPAIPRENRFKQRAIFWHDLPQTRAAWGSVLRRGGPFTGQADLLLTHGLHFAARCLSLDRGFDLLRRLSPAAAPRPARSEAAEIARRQGFLPYTEDSYTFSEERRAFLADPAAYARQVRRLAELRAEGEPSSGSRDGEIFAAQIAELERARIAAVYLVPATTQALPAIGALHRRGELPRLLDFGDPSRYPELYAPERRFDTEHLTQEGAELFSRLLAERFSREIL